MRGLRGAEKRRMGGLAEPSLLHAICTTVLLPTPLGPACRRKPWRNVPPFNSGAVRRASHNCNNGAAQCKA